MASIDTSIASIVNKSNAYPIADSKGKTDSRLVLKLTETDNEIYKIAVLNIPVNSVKAKILLTSKKWGGGVTVGDQQVLVNIKSLSKRLGIEKAKLVENRDDVTEIVNERVIELANNQKLKEHTRQLHLGFTSKQIAYINDLINKNEDKHLSHKTENLPLSVTVRDGQAYVHGEIVGMGTAKVAKRILDWNTEKESIRITPKRKIFRDGNLKELNGEEIKKNENRVEREKEIRSYLDPNHPGIIQTKSIEDIKKGKKGYILENLPIGFEEICGSSDKFNIPMHIKAYMLLQAGRGLAHMHEQGVLHLDIKPENLRGSYDPVTQTGIGKLGDYDLSLKPNKENAAMIAVRGTPGYVPPEVIERGMSQPFSLPLINERLNSLEQGFNQVANKLYKISEDDPELLNDLERCLTELKKLKGSTSKPLMPRECREITKKIFDLEVELEIAQSASRCLTGDCSVGV